MSSLYSIDLMNQIASSFESADFSEEEVMKFRFLDFRDLRLLVNGKATVVQIPEEVTKKAKRVLTPFLILRTEPTTKEQLVADIETNKCRGSITDEVSDAAKKMIGNKKFTISSVVENVSFVALSIGADLGFINPKGPRTSDFMTDEFCRKWSAENLDGQVIELCLPDDSLRIRKIWLDQLKNTQIWCSMDYLSGDSPADLSVWGLWRDSFRRYLLLSSIKSSSRWDIGVRVVFRLRTIT